MIRNFISKVQARLNLGAALHAFTMSLLIGALAAILAALCYIINGHGVPLLVCISAAAVVLVGGVILWFRQRQSALQAAAYADAHFDLKDALTSSLEFEKQHGMVYDIQREQTESAIKLKDPSSIPVKVKRGLVLAALLSTTTAAALAFVPPSQAVLDKQAQEQLTELRTEEIKRELKDAVEELIKSLSDEEKEAINPDELRQWVKELKQTGDKREALRNYARLEQKLQKTIDKLDQRKDEELLKNAGLKLEKASDADAKEMGKKLQQKDFKSAADKLKKFKLGKNKANKEPHKKIDPKTKKKFKLTKEQKAKLAKRQKQLAKLRQLSKRLAQASRQRKGKQGKGKNNKSSNSKGQGNDDLGKMLENLDDDAEALEEMLEAMELALEKGEEPDDQDLEEGFEELDEDIDELRKRLKRMNAKRKARQRMKKLRGALGKAQSYANGQSNRLGLGAGGKKPGYGSDSTERKQKNPLTDNGNYDRLKGQKGAGLSQSSIESAESGTGTSNRSGEATTQRSFERQMDAFVERDDIPEEMKEGVKEYFKNIHENQPADPSE